MAFPVLQDVADLVVDEAFSRVVHMQPLAIPATDASSTIGGKPEVAVAIFGHVGRNTGRQTVLRRQ